MSRDLVLAALGEGSRLPADYLPGNLRPDDPGSPSIDRLWARFETMLAALGGRLASMDDLESAFSKRAWIDEDAGRVLEEIDRLPRLGPALVDIWEAEVGITTADLAIAETGSLLVSSGPGKLRMASLAPPVHIALIRRSEIVESLDQAIARCGPSSSVIITGPSRTADIEGIIIRGVHGPGELLVLVH